MIEYPKDLAGTMELVGYKPLTLNEDVIADLSKYWLRAGTIISGETDRPKKDPDAIWKASWSRGHDRPLDAFVEFYDSYPLKHGHDAAAQAPKISSALNGVAAIVTAHKHTAITALQTTKKYLSGNGHILGPTFHSFLGVHLQRYTSHDQEDRKTISTASDYLAALNNETTSEIDTQTKIINMASANFDGILRNIAATVESLRGVPQYMKQEAQNPRDRNYGWFDHDSWLDSDDPHDWRP